MYYLHCFKIDKTPQIVALVAYCIMWINVDFTYFYRFRDSNVTHEPVLNMLVFYPCIFTLCSF